MSGTASGKAPFAIDPLPRHAPSGPFSHAANFLGAEFVRRFGPDGFAACERDRQAELVDRNTLCGAGPQMHLDSRLTLVVACLVGETRQIESAAQLAIDARQQIQIEGRGHAQRIVIGAQQGRSVFDQVGAQQQCVAGNTRW